MRLGTPDCLKGLNFVQDLSAVVGVCDADGDHGPMRGTAITQMTRRLNIRHEQTWDIWRTHPMDGVQITISETSRAVRGGENQSFLSLVNCSLNIANELEDAWKKSVINVFATGSADYVKRRMSLVPPSFPPVYPFGYDIGSNSPSPPAYVALNVAAVAGCHPSVRDPLVVAGQWADKARKIIRTVITPARMIGDTYLPLDDLTCSMLCREVAQQFNALGGW